MKKLPDKPSELIELALADLEKVEKLPEVYDVYMPRWHRPSAGKCMVCLAGAVLAQTLSTDPKKNIELSGSLDESGLDKDTWRKLRSLDDFRCGRIGEGLYEMGLIGIDESYNRSELEIEDEERIDDDLYAESPMRFKAELRNVADRLRAEGY